MPSLPSPLCPLLHRRPPWLLAAAIVALGLATLAPASAQAQATFTPIKPPVCPSLSHALMNWTSSQSPPNPNSPSDYGNSFTDSRRLVTNPWITRARIRFLEFNTEQDFDFVYLGTPFTSTQHTLHGPVGATNPEIVSSFGLQQDPAYLVFSSEFMVGESGFRADLLSYCTDRTSIPADPTTEVSYLETGRPLHGVLQGTNDVVFFRTGNLAGFDHIGLTLRMAAPNNINNDFDVYVRCGSPPTPSTFDVRGFSSNEQEFVDITSCINGNLWVAVHAFRGAGAFVVDMQPHWAGGHRPMLRAGTETVQTNQTTIDTMRTTLAQGARHLYGASSGTMLIENIQFFNTGNCKSATGCGGSACDICFADTTSTGRSQATLCAFAGNPGKVQMHPNNWNSGEVLSHELGHAFYCLGDEYDTVTPDNSDPHQCGYSTMARSTGGNNNFCHANEHELDIDPRIGVMPGFDFTTLFNANQQANSSAVIPVTWSTAGDNYDYIDNDMNLAVGNVF